MKSRILWVLVFSILLVIPNWSQANAAEANAPGSLDLTFDPTANGSRVGLSGGEPLVDTVLQQPDGKVLIGGWFTGVNGSLRNNIARLNPDGSVDESFQPGYGPDGGVLSLALQGDGKILIIGSFRHVGSKSHPLIARLNADGSVDDSFSCHLEGDANLRLTGVAVQQSGKIWIGGQFTNVNSVARQNLARLNSDGSLDVTVDPRAEVPGTCEWVSRLVLQSDDKLLVAGAWSGPQRNLTRFTAEGSLDAAFATVVVEYPIIGPSIRNLSFNSTSGAIAIVGHFTSVNGVPRRHVARLNPNGTPDTRFNAGQGPDYNFLWTVSMQSDDKMVVGGNFHDFNGSAREGIARLNADGTVDSGFDPGNAAGVATGYYAHITAIVPHSDGGVLVASSAWWTHENTNTVFHLDTTGNRLPDISPLLSAPVEGVGRMVLQPDGKVIFATFGSYTRNGLVRVHANGLYDESFVPELEPGYVFATALQPDNRILVATPTTFSSQQGAITRLHPDGSVDDEFQAPIVDGGEAPIEALALQPDGKILVAGLVWSVEGHPHQGIVRLLPNGSFDTSFQPVPVHVTDDPGYGIEHALALPDGKILIAGGFTWNTGEAAGIALLESDGTVDQDFAANVTTVYYVHSVARQPDGKFLLSAHSERPGPSLIRINPDGTDDPTFRPAIEGEFYGMELQADGRILLTTGSGGVARLNADGSLDPTFQTGVFASGADDLLIQPDGRVLVSGGFHSVDGIPMHGIVRLNNDVRWRLEVTAKTPGPLEIEVSGQAGVPLVIEASNDFTTWTTVTELTTGATPVTCSDPDSANFTQRFYRARQKQ